MRFLSMRGKINLHNYSPSHPTRLIAANSAPSSSDLTPPDRIGRFQPTLAHLDLRASHLQKCSAEISKLQLPAGERKWSLCWLPRPDPDAGSLGTPGLTEALQNATWAVQGDHRILRTFFLPGIISYGMQAATFTPLQGTGDDQVCNLQEVA